MMAAPGRKPKPTRLKAIEGNPGKRPLTRNEPKPTPVAPSCPSWLDTEAKAEWRRVAPELERLGLLTLVDRAALTGYCLAWSHLVTAEKAMQPEGHISPHFTVFKASLQAVRAFCTEFGLTPSSRGRMSLPADDGDDPEGILD